MSPFPKLSCLLLTLVFSKSFADVSPDLDAIFSAENVAGMLTCNAGTYPGDISCTSVATVDPKTGKSTGTADPTSVHLTGGGEPWTVVFAYGQKKINATDSYFLIDSADGRVWIRTKSEHLSSFSPPGASEADPIYALNPRLQQVYLTKDGKRPMRVDAIRDLKDNPNEQIGVVTITLDGKAAKNPRSTQSVRFFYPNYGEKRLNSYELMQLEQKRPQGTDPLEVKLPVFRKTAAGYLVQVPAEWGDVFFDEGKQRYRAALKPSNSEFDDLELYAWIESKTTSLVFKAGANDMLPQADSPSVKFSMDRGPYFKKDGVAWTSLKINALYLDFDPKRIDEHEGMLNRKKVLLREVFLPVYDAKKRVQFWLDWEPGC